MIGSIIETIDGSGLASGTSLDTGLLGMPTAASAVTSGSSTRGRAGLAIGSTVIGRGVESKDDRSDDFKGPEPSVLVTDCAARDVGCPPWIPPVLAEEAIGAELIVERSTATGS